MSVFDDMGPWGYCKTCHRLVLIHDDANVLIGHNRALSSGDCAGSGWPPTEDIPPELTAEQERKLTGIG